MSAASILKFYLQTPNRTAALQAARRKIAMDQNFSVNDTTQERAKVDSSISSHGTYTDFTVGRQQWVSTLTFSW